jgi:large subunit ribosomal protein L24
MSIRREDTVLVIGGKERGKTGKVRRVLPDESSVIVEGLNIVKRHMKPRSSQARQAGIIEKEAPLHVSNVALLCPKCNLPARVGHKLLADGTKARVCKRCSEVIEDARRGR